MVSSVEQPTTAPVLPFKKAVDRKGIGASGGEGEGEGGGRDGGDAHSWRHEWHASAMPRMSHASTESNTRWARAVRGMAATRNVVRIHGSNCRRLGGWWRRRCYARSRCTLARGRGKTAKGSPPEGRKEGILDTHTRYASPAKPADDQQYLDPSTYHRRAP